MITKTIFLVILGGVLFFSCNPEKELQRKEDKSLGIVEGSKRVFPIAGADWQNIHPCVITTPKPDSIKSKSDTVIQEKKVYIPFKTIEFKHRVIDTIIDGISVYADSNGVSVKNLNEVVTNTETIIKTIVDQTLVNNQKDTINSLRIQLSNLVGYDKAFREQSKQQITDITSDKKWWIRAAIGTWIALVVALCLFLYIKIFK